MSIKGNLVCTSYRYEIDLYGPQYFARRMCLEERLDVCILDSYVCQYSKL